MLMTEDTEVEAKKIEAGFKNLLLIHRPEQYKKIYIDQPIADEDVEWIRPQSPEEVKELLDELRETGLDLEFDETDGMTDFSRFDKMREEEPAVTLPEEEPTEDPPHSDDTTDPDFYDALDSQDIL